MRITRKSLIVVAVKRKKSIMIAANITIHVNTMIRANITIHVKSRENISAASAAAVGIVTNRNYKTNLHFPFENAGLFRRDRLLAPPAPRPEPAYFPLLSEKWGRVTKTVMAQMGSRDAVPVPHLINSIQNRVFSYCRVFSYAIDSLIDTLIMGYLYFFCTK